ncbi:MAG: hypothetical protein AAB473_00075 [Patescibacteria group bacterium]
MKFFPIFTLGALTLTLVGAGCMKSLEARVSQYEDERKVCVEEKRSASPTITFNGLTRPWDEGDDFTAEYRCSTVDLAKKYYQQDPEGVIELCVRTKQIGMYTYEKGLGGSLTSKELEQLHTSETFADITMDSQGKVTIGDTTLENWRGLCKTVIEGVIEGD